MTTEFVSTTGDGLCICVAPLGGTSVADATTLRTSIAGRLSGTTSDVAQQVKARAAFVCSELTILATANDVGSASSCRLRVGAANVNLVATITASTPGVYSDSSNSDTLSTTSLINTNVVVPSVSGSHAVVMGNITLYTHIDPADWVITKLYFHATATSGLPAGTLPTAEQSTNTSNLNFEAESEHKPFNERHYRKTVKHHLLKAFPSFHLKYWIHCQMGITLNLSNFNCCKYLDL